MSNALQDALTKQVRQAIFSAIAKKADEKMIPVLDVAIDEIASRDAEVAELKLKLTKFGCVAASYMNERDQLREQVNLAHIALVEIGQRSSCYKKSECIDGQTKYGKGSYEDDFNSAMGGIPWQICHCFPESYFKALATTEQK